MNGMSPHIYPMDATSYLFSSVPEKSVSLLYYYKKLSDAIFIGDIQGCEKFAREIPDINAILCFYNFKNSYTLLNDAVRFGNRKIVIILLYNGACPDSPNLKGKTARMLAKKTANTDIVNLFQRHKPENVQLSAQVNGETCTIL
ncbi:MAG: hypothetical protein H0V82_00775 [Candidatus Protochlamydia sp.]|nr:hypothetical protein [Candidatus Protochlamydia sp.]